MIPSESCIETSKERTLRLIDHGLSKKIQDDDDDDDEKVC